MAKAPIGTLVRGEKNGRAVLTEKQVKSIRKEYRPRIISCRVLAEKYGVSVSTINKIVKGDRWTW